jgi:hypothetical protein
MRRVEITEPALLIRIPRLFNERMSERALYEATRGDWKISNRRDAVRFALAVAGGVVQEVYAVGQWQPAGSTQYSTRPKGDVHIAGRWEFTGVVAPASVRDKYFGNSVAHYFSRGASNPITYVNV